MKKYIALMISCVCIYVLLVFYVVGDEETSAGARFFIALMGFICGVVVPTAIADCNEWFKQKNN